MSTARPQASTLVALMAGVSEGLRSVISDIAFLHVLIAGNVFGLAGDHDAAPVLCCPLPLPLAGTLPDWRR
jgi:hypothetical protein